MEYTFTVANFEEEVLNSPLPVLVGVVKPLFLCIFQHLQEHAVHGLGGVGGVTG